MLFYQRNIVARLWLLRLLLLLLVALFVYCATQQVANGAYFIAVVFLFASLITITNVEIQYQSVALTRYHFFGLVRRTHSLTSKRIELFSFYKKERFIDGGELVTGLFTIFFPVNFKFQGMVVKKTEGNIEMRIRLNDAEYKMIQQIVEQNPLYVKAKGGDALR